MQQGTPSIGKVSYGMYVLHPFIIEGLRRTDIKFNIVGLLLTAGLSYAAALLSWHLYEKHFLKLKKYFEYSWRQTVAKVA